MHKKISVVICTHNRAQLLAGALRSLDNQSFFSSDYEIVVVDDGSTDDTEEVARTAGLACDLQYFKIEHAGRAAARNKGIKECTGDYLLFVDDDILAPPELIAEHYQWHQKFRHCVVRGPIINVTDYKIPDGRASTWRDYSSAFFCTCNASVNKFALVAVGGFDEAFIEYGFEDNELGWRLRDNGWCARFNKRAIVYHFKPTLEKKQLAEMIGRAQELGRSAVAYFRKHPHWKVAFATGLHPVLAWWNRLQCNPWLHRYCMRQWYDSAEKMPEGRRAFIERRIFTYHYLRSLEAEQKVQRCRAAVQLEQDATVIGSTTSSRAVAGVPKGGPVIGKSGRIVNKNIRANVHVQPKTPPEEGSDSAF